MQGREIVKNCTVFRAVIILFTQLGGIIISLFQRRFRFDLDKRTPSSFIFSFFFSARFFSALLLPSRMVSGIFLFRAGRNPSASNLASSYAFRSRFRSPLAPNAPTSCRNCSTKRAAFTSFSSSVGGLASRDLRSRRCFDILPASEGAAAHLNPFCG